MAKHTLTVDKAELEQFIKSAIKDSVNGKIDRIAEHLKKQDRVIERNQALLTKHIETLKPYMEGADFIQKLYRYARWIWPILLSFMASYYAARTYLNI